MASGTDRRGLRSEVTNDVETGHGRNRVTTPRQLPLETPPGGIGSALATILAEARAARQDLADDRFARLARGAVKDLLSERRTLSAASILEWIADRRPPLPMRSESGDGHPGVAPLMGAPPLTEERVRRELVRAIERLLGRDIPSPTQAEIANAHSPALTERGLRKRIARYPHLRPLMPRS